MSASTPSAGTWPQAPHRSAFWPAAWLTILLALTKVTYVGMATFWTWATSPKDYVSTAFLQWAAAASQADTLFGAAAGGVAAVVLWWSRDRPRLARVLGWAIVALGALLLVYAAVSRQAYAYYSAPLTYQLLLLAGEPARLWSSISAFVTPRSVLTVVGLPVAFLLLTVASERVDRSLGRPARRAVRMALLAAAGGWLVLGQSQLQSRWFEAQDRHLKESPHWVFLHSLALATGDGSSVLAATSFAASEADDFRGSDAARGKARGARPAGHSGSRRPNVVLIVLESVGTRYLGIYGSALETTPSLQSERQSLLVFDNYYAPVGWTAYSLLSLTMAQRPPMERYNEVSFKAASLRGASVAEVLAAAGYQTAFMAAGDPDWASAGFLERSGFRYVFRGADLSGAAPISSWGTEDRHLFEKMADWIDDNAGAPFFLMAWTDQTHHPYTVAPGQHLVDVLDSERRAENPALARYTSLVRAADAHIGRFLAWLRARGLADDTIVVITGDHGEGFGEPRGGSGHGFTVYDEEVKVPLVLWNPKRFRQAGRSAMVGSHIDLAPTILDLVGLDVPTGWDGVSLFDEHRAPRAYLFAAAWGQYLLGVRSGRWKYVYDARLGREELFDLEQDPDELRDVSRDEPERAVELRRRLAAWLAAEGQRADLRKTAAGS